MGNVNDSNRDMNRNINRNSRVYNSYDVERVKNRQTAHNTGASGRYVHTQTSNVRGGAQSHRANQSYTRRSPQVSRRKRKGSSGPLWMIIFLLCVIVVLAVVFLVKYLDDDGGAGMAETTGGFESGAPGQTDGGATGIQTAETTDAITTVPETTAQPEAPEIPVPSFTADLSAYEMYMNPQGDQRDAYLILVNPDNPVSADYKPSDLVDVKSTRQDGQRKAQQLREYAAKALEALMLEADACGMVTANTPSGYPLSVMSAYRSYDYQISLFESWVQKEFQKGAATREEAESRAEKYSCRAGTSEHQTGLCVDMHTLSGAHESFRYEDEAKWLAENCYKFGFILRFPEDKTDITKINYEPWHFRYVGRYHATRMHELDMCLEEYTEYLKTHG